MSSKQTTQHVTNERIDLLVTMLNSHNEPAMKKFISKMDGIWHEIPNDLFMYLEYWARNPAFDADNHPYFLIPGIKSHVEIAPAHWMRQCISALEPVTNGNAVVPVVYNNTSDGYGFDKKVYDLLCKCNIYALIGIEIYTPYVYEYDDSYDNPPIHKIAEKLPRHHMLFVACVVMLSSRQHRYRETALTITTVPKLCIDSYRICKYDGAELIDNNIDKAIAMIACNLPNATESSEDTLRGTVLEMQNVIKQLQYIPSKSHMSYDYNL